VTFKSIISSFFVFSALATACIAGDRKDEDSAVTFEPIVSVTITELWALGQPSVVRSKGLPIILYWPFGPDEIQMEGDKRLIGIVAGGLTDVGITPVVAKVWVSENIFFLEDKSQSSSYSLPTKATVIFGIPSALCTKLENIDCEGMKFEFSIIEEGSVFINDEWFGHVS
jgi:hypothetical protein